MSRTRGVLPRKAKCSIAIRRSFQFSFQFSFGRALLSLLSFLFRFVLSCQVSTQPPHRNSQRWEVFLPTDPIRRRSLASGEAPPEQCDVGICGVISRVWGALLHLAAPQSAQVQCGHLEERNGVVDFNAMPGEEPTRCQDSTSWSLLGCPVYRPYYKIGTLPKALLFGT